MKILKSNGITLISLVITIIIIVILAGISINMLIGPKGVITTANQARKEMIIAEGKEKIELALQDMYIEKTAKGDNCTLDYISENIDGKIKGVTLEGIKGNPVVKIYLAYKDYMFKITSDLKVELLGNINIKEEPELEIIRDVTETGVEEINLTVNATVEEGEISEIVKPDGTVEYTSQVIYSITENGNYTFKAITEKGIIEQKTITIESIKQKNAIELITSGEMTEEMVSCTHIYETKYDSENHWKQCILCNNKIDNVKHSLTIIGQAGCASKLGKQTEYCTDGCGYKIELPKQAHISDGIFKGTTYNNQHIQHCSVCNGKMKTGKCTNEKGEILGCKTGISGTCVTCGTERTIVHLELQNGKCVVCGKEFYKSELSKEILNQTQIKVKYKYIPIVEGLEFNAKRSPEASGTSNVSVTDYKFTKNDDGSIEIEAILNVTKDTPTNSINMRGWFNFKYEESSEDGYDTIVVKPDNYAPTVKSIEIEGANSSVEFSRSAKITAKFEETWDSVVEMALYDSDGTVIADWSAAKQDGTTFTKEFNVLVETTTSKELTLKAKDRCGNIGEGKVTVGKIDTKAPELVSPTNYNDTWKISLPIKIEATDEGSGNVQIGLGSETDYQLGNLEEGKYTRSYNFVGDIYEDIVRILYLKDDVGNVVTKRITIGKLDRTSPKITNITANNKTITIEANDINKNLNKEGSGIKGYAISKSREVPSDNGFQTNNTFTVEETGIYYIWVKDNAQNLSETRQIEIK